MLEQGQAVNVTVSGGQEQATVPQLVGLTSIESARLALSDANLQLGEIKQRDSEQPPGYVLDQNPAEGSAVDAGTAVSITISTGNLVVPDVIGASEAQARSDVVQAGFVIQVVYQESADFIEGTVIAQAPLPGGQLARGSLVTITVVTAPLPVTPTTGPGPDDSAPAPQPTTPVVPVPEPTPVPTPVASP